MNSSLKRGRSSSNARHDSRQGIARRSSSPWLPRLPQISRLFLEQLTTIGLIAPSTVHPFLEERADRLVEYIGEVEIGQALIQAGLLTSFQLNRVLAGETHGLILGNYCVLDKIGCGGMGLVYVGEHSLMKRRVAIKVLPVDDTCDPSMRQRFFAEMRLLAELNHPNIVQAFDAGEVLSGGPTKPLLMYLVMEHITGGDLEHHVEKVGPLPISQACEWVRQAALGLQAAHDLHIVHRDIKPSNLLLTEKGQIKLVDFGLAHEFCSHLTDPRALLGSVEFMAPEQSHDPSGVGPEADVYGLAATMFWVLTGEAPYPYSPNIGSALRALQCQSPRKLSDLRPDVPPELDQLMDQMLSRDPSARPTPLAISTAMASFSLSTKSKLAPSNVPQLTSHGESWASRRILIAESDPAVAALMRSVVEWMGCSCSHAENSPELLTLATKQTFDLVLLDLGLPGMSGMELCRRLRDKQSPYLKILVVSGQGAEGELSQALGQGADDFLTKPFEVRQMKARIEQALRVKVEQERVRALAEQHERVAKHLEQSLLASKADVREAHDAVLFTMAKMAEARDGESLGHLKRLQKYVTTLAKAAACERPWAGLIDERYLTQLERCVVLHDIGKIGLPDDILLKPASLSEAERILVQTHPLIGDRLLEALAQEYGNAMDFLNMARDIVRHHHERWDGTGYPDRLKGNDIPPAARLTAMADVYDALRRERLHKPPLNHARAVTTILQQSLGQFDPSLLVAFDACHSQFERIYREIGF